MVEEWNVVAADTGHHALRAADGEDKNLGEQLVDDGIEEATHDQMLEARIEERKEEESLSRPNVIAAGENRRRNRNAHSDLIERFRQVRNFSTRLCRGLQPEDCVVQSMPDVSPTKWHLAHTSWFFETFVLKVWMPEYQPAVPEYAYLFNSYYNAAGSMHRRDLRGLISRPTVAETLRFREHRSMNA